MQTNAYPTPYTATESSSRLQSAHAEIGTAAPAKTDLTTARVRLEDRFRQEFAERSRQIESMGPCGTRDSAAPGDWRKQ